MGRDRPARRRGRRCRRRRPRRRPARRSVSARPDTAGRRPPACARGRGPARPALHHRGVEHDADVVEGDAVERGAEEGLRPGEHRVIEEHRRHRRGRGPTSCPMHRLDERHELGARLREPTRATQRLTGEGQGPEGDRAAQLGDRRLEVHHELGAWCERVDLAREGAEAAHVVGVGPATLGVVEHRPHAEREIEHATLLHDRGHRDEIPGAHGDQRHQRARREQLDRGGDLGEGSVSHQIRLPTASGYHATRCAGSLSTEEPC